MGTKACLALDLEYDGDEIYGDYFDDVGNEGDESSNSKTIYYLHRLRETFTRNATPRPCLQWNSGNLAKRFNFVFRFWDDGQSTMPLDREVHDEGGVRSNPATSSWSAAGKHTWISANEASSLLNKNGAGFTPEKFTDIYTEVWSADPLHAEAIDDTDADAESTVDGKLCQMKLKRTSLHL